MMATTIWDEVIDGNIAGVRNLLENVNVRNGLGETPLHLAARHGLEEIAEVSGYFAREPTSHLVLSRCHQAFTPPSILDVNLCVNIQTHIQTFHKHSNNNS